MTRSLPPNCGAGFGEDMGVFNIAQESSFEAGKLTFPEAFHMVMTNFLGKVIFFSLPDLC